MGADASKLILGTVQFGVDYGINNPAGKPSLPDTISILSLARESGIDTLDTAEAYGNAMEVIGAYHQSKPHFKIISKFSSGEDITGKCTSALKALGIDCFEAYLFHSFDNFIQSSEKVIPALTRLKQENKIKKIGVSVYTNNELEVINEHPEIDLVQLPFNLLDNDSKRGNLLKKAKEAGKEIHARSVFLQGLFFMNESEVPVILKPLLPYLKRIKEIAMTSAVPMQALAMQYVLKNKHIDRVLFGVDNKAQLIQNLEWIKFPVPDKTFDEVNALDVKEIDLLNPVNWK